MTKKKIVVPVSDEVSKLSQVLLDRTIKYVGKYFGQSVVKTELTVPTKLQSVVDAFNKGDWGCQRDSVLGIVSALAGADITPYVTDEDVDGDCIDSDDLVAGLVLVPTRSDNNHSYDIGRVCMSTMPECTDNFLCCDGYTKCDDLDVDSNCLRLPTLEEVKEFVQKNLDVIKKHVVV